MIRSATGVYLVRWCVDLRPSIDPPDLPCTTQTSVTSERPVGMGRKDYPRHVPPRSAAFGGRLQAPEQDVAHRVVAPARVTRDALGAVVDGETPARRKHPVPGG